ncbi:hypothetical protein ACHQM5_010744 [Ranunculus cassubicifolius]
MYKFPTFQRTIQLFSYVKFSVHTLNLPCYPISITSFSTTSTNLSLKFLKNTINDDSLQVSNNTPPPDIYQYTMMITSYCHSNRINEALQLFDKMPVKDTVSWNCMIKGCLDCGDLKLGLKLFDEMPERNVISWTTVVSGCAQFGKLDMAKELFDKMPCKDIAAWNAMLFGYCSNGRFEDAWELFEKMPRRNVISWTTMIGALDQGGRCEKALFLFQDMCLLGVKPTSSTYTCVVTACANIRALQYGVQLHAHVVKIGEALDTFVSSALITFYANCLQMESSVKVFREKLDTCVVRWTALLTGYGVNGKHEEALKLFHAMMNSGIMPNQSTFTSALHSCSELRELGRGKGLHTQTIKVGLDFDVFVGNSLIGMYTRSGSVDDGISIFNSMSKRNVVSWNAAIVGSAQNGCGDLSFELFDQMKQAKVPPDVITYVGLLTACSHSRLFEKGKYVFKLLNQDPSVGVTLEHYACMVDILGRSGKLEEAEEFILNMPMKPNVTIWMALLSACQVHSNLEMAKRAAQHVLDREPHNSAAHVQLSNLYASAGWWNEASKIRKVMKEQGFVKETGSSWLNLTPSR